MNSYSGSINQTQYETFFAKREVGIAIDPVDILELRASVILDNLRNMEYSEQEALGIYSQMIEILNGLKSLCLSVPKTTDFIEEKIKNIKTKGLLITILYLLEATSHNSMFKHARYCFEYQLKKHIPSSLIFSFTIDSEKIEIELKENFNNKHPEIHLNGKLSLQQIALKYAWEGKLITKQNKDEIANHFGYNSGDKLYENFCKWSKRKNRTADPDGSKKQIENKMELLNSVIEILPESFKQKALVELTELESIYNTSYLKK
jgi:hypothetical protein